MEKEFVPYELAVKLKELRFTQFDMLAWYILDDGTSFAKSFINIGNNGFRYAGDSCIATPLWQQAFDWFREKHNLSNSILFNSLEYYWWITETNLYGIDVNSTDEKPFMSYEEARKACLEKLIDLIK